MSVSLRCTTTATNLLQLLYENTTHSAKKNEYINRSMVYRVLDKFKATGSVSGDKERSGRPAKVRSNLNIEKIKRKLEQSPKRSVRRLSSETGLSKSTVQRILKDDLKLFPYKIQIVPKLTPSNKKNRDEFAHQICDKMELKGRKKLNIRSIHFTDEAHFLLSGHVNKQNMRIWGEENPHASVEKLQSREKCTVWAAVTDKKVIGPYFFEEGGSSCTVDGERYKKMLKSYYIPQVKRYFDVNQVIFQQDGAPPHIAGPVLELLRETFGDRLISRSCDFKWPAYSPDLNPCDFFLWGYLKSRVYRNPVPQDVDQLKNNIRREIRLINAQTLEKVYENFLVRVQQVLGKKGSYMEHILNY